MTQEEKLDKLIETAARIAAAFIVANNAETRDGEWATKDCVKVAMRVAKAIITEAEKEA